MTDHLRIHAGTIITCENGHEICTARVDIMGRDVMSPSQFHKWVNAKEPEPYTSAENSVCDKCGASWLLIEDGNGVFLHTKDGWN